MEANCDATIGVALAAKSQSSVTVFVMEQWQALNDPLRQRV